MAIGAGEARRLPPKQKLTFEECLIEGFWLREDWVLSTPPPRAMDVLRELGVT
jgi:hypothetical protein